MGRSYIVITCHAFCSEGRPVTLEYSSDRQHFDEREDAARHGFKMEESDDFNIGAVEDGELVDLLWMEMSVSEDTETLAKIAREIGL